MANNKIRKIVQLKQVMKRWKSMSLGKTHHHHRSESSSYSDQFSNDIDSRNRKRSLKRIPSSGNLAVYIGPERRRFVIPTRYLNLPIFVSLLKKSEEEYGFQSNGGLVLPCEVVFFKRVLKLLDKDENRFRRLELDEFLNLLAADNTVDPNYCREGAKDFGFTPLLPKTRA
ncbi:hypothetical protein MKW94_005199 [Papaver nudicaule]|uniref:Uncharacterized protein n=1 Tax=Papaver nudicaule TaxID=74823 RepID=A0AA41VMR5_PAPNU|nr:hypothetical protein [Papaver nudicaule]